MNNNQINCSQHCAVRSTATAIDLHPSPRPPALEPSCTLLRLRRHLGPHLTSGIDLRKSVVRAFPLAAHPPNFPTTARIPPPSSSAGANRRTGARAVSGDSAPAICRMLSEDIPREGDKSSEGAGTSAPPTAASLADALPPPPPTVADLRCCAAVPFRNTWCVFGASCPVEPEDRVEATAAAAAAAADPRMRGADAAVPRGGTIFPAPAPARVGFAVEVGRPLACGGGGLKVPRSARTGGAGDTEEAAATAVAAVVAAAALAVEGARLVLVRPRLLAS